jgi:hypothetical protein
MQPVDSLQARKELLRRILESSQFAQTDSLKRILQYLFDRSQESDETSPKEHEIAVDVLRRPASFDPRTDPIVRVHVSSIRARLRTYYENEGRGEPLQLLIPKGQYRVSFARADRRNRRTEPVAARVEARTRFWDPYLSGDAPNILVYSELLCFRDERGNFIRNMYVNDVAVGFPEMQARFPQFPATGVTPSYNFVSAGEIRAILAIEGAFREMGAPLEIRISRAVSWSDLQSSNLILFGSSRTNPFLDSLQGNDAFVITGKYIEDRNAGPGEEPKFPGRRFMDGRLERLVEYAVVTRRPGVLGNGSVTIIGANHGRAMEGAGVALAREEKVADLLVAMGWAQSAAPPPHFQVLLRIDMIDFDEEVVNVDYVKHWAP